MRRIWIAIVPLLVAACAAAPAGSVAPSLRSPAASPGVTASGLLTPSSPDASAATPATTSDASPSDAPPGDTGTPGPCPSSPMTAEALMTAYGSCFDAGTIKVRGWLAPPEGVGGTNNGISPSWLGEWATDLVIWAAPPTSAFCGSASCGFEFVHVPPGSGVSLGAPERWVELTGHYGDAAASTCHFTGTDFNGIGDAVAYCRKNFVATAVRDIAAPG